MNRRGPVVAYVCSDPGVPVFGRKGASVHVRAILTELTRRASTVHLFASRFGGPVPTALEGVVRHEVPCPRGPARERERALVAADDALGEALSELDVLDLLYQRYSLWSCAAVELARDRGWPSVLEINSPLVEEQARHRTLVDRRTATERTRRAIEAASAPYAVSEGVARWANGLSARPIPVVANGVDPERFAAPVRRGSGRIGDGTRTGSASGRDEVVVGFVGTFRPWHDLDRVVDAVATVGRRPGAPRLRLLLVGDGPGLGGTLGRAAACGVAVESTGSVPADVVPELLGRMDVGLAAYPPGERYFSPLKVFEYLAAGVPVVASAVGGLDRLLESGREAFLSRPGDHAALAEHLRVLCTDPGRRRAMGEAGRRAAVERHSWSHVLDRVMARLPAPVPA